MLQAADSPVAVCAASGRSNLALHKVGDRLSVDRISPFQGYVEGNMQLLSLKLNIAKGDEEHIPDAALNLLVRSLAYVSEDKISDVPGATEKV